jgi:hypothetical protein
MLRLVPNGRKAWLLLAIHRTSTRLAFESVRKVTQATPQGWIWLAYGGQNGSRRNSLATGRATPKAAPRLFGQFLTGRWVNKLVPARGIGALCVGVLLDRPRKRQTRREAGAQSYGPPSREVAGLPKGARNGKGTRRRLPAPHSRGSPAKDREWILGRMPRMH